MKQPRTTPLNQVEQQYDYASAAAVLNMGLSTIRRYVATGAIAPVYKFNRKQVRIPASSLNTFLEQHAIGAACNH